jgi:hypothetical protein
MSPNRVRSRQDAIQQEGRILLAIQAIKNKEIGSIRQAAEQFQVDRSTLTRRLRGTTSRAETRPNSHKLTEIEEESLLQWILSMDDRGGAPRPAMVREMAALLLQHRGINNTTPIGQNWVTKFVNRHPEIKSRFSRRYNYERAKQEDPKVIRQWFTTVQDIITTYGILSEDIYNFDETDFAMGLTSTARVITRAEYYGRRSVLQPGNRTWVTAIESINASGWVLPPTIIFKGKVYKESWFDNLPPDWRFEVSANGWTTDEIGLRWLQKVFIPSTNLRTLGQYRLLVLDGHGSHLTPQFDQICSENKIIPVCMPAHSSHLLQPLDIGCFAVLKRSYGSLVDQKMRLNVNHIDKLDFLAAYPQARIDAFKSDTIKNSFKAAGLVSIDPEPVLNQLNIQLRTPTPLLPEQPLSQSSIYYPTTPITIAQLTKHAISAKTLLKYRSESPPTPTKQVVDQAYKALGKVMTELLFTKEENKGLRAELEKKKQKRRRSNRNITHDGGLSVQDAYELIQAPEPVPQAPVPQPALRAQRIQTDVAPSQRRLPKCGKCGEIGHKRNACPARD